MNERDVQRPTLRERLLWAAGLGALFVVAYGGTNLMTAHRADVGVIQFDWEGAIPVVPWMIVPYMSIDLFFIASLFLCRSTMELRTHGKRLALATVLAGICFLLVPLQLAATRPQLDGFPGVLHDLLKMGDQPYNLYPSLHVTYLLLLWCLYHRRTNGVMNAALHVWFVLVLPSVLFVHQHHFIDMVGGAVLAVTVLYVLPMRGGDEAAWMKRPLVARPEVALRYALGAAALLVIVSLPQLPGLLRFLAAWIVVALIIMACAHWFAGPAVYRKSDGAIPIGTRVMLAPHMIGLWLTRMYWFRKSPCGFNQVLPELWIGRVLRPWQAADLRSEGIIAVLDLTAEHRECPLLRKGTYHNTQILDTTLPTLEHLRDAVAFLQRHAAGGPVFVHCGIGYTRSAAVAAAYILAQRRASTVEQAIGIVRQGRPQIVLKPRLVEVLEMYRLSLP